MEKNSNKNKQEGKVIFYNFICNFTIYKNITFSSFTGLHQAMGRDNFFVICNRTFWRPCTIWAFKVNGVKAKLLPKKQTWVFIRELTLVSKSQ